MHQLWKKLELKDDYIHYISENFVDHILHATHTVARRFGICCDSSTDLLDKFPKNKTKFSRLGKCGLENWNNKQYKKHTNTSYKLLHNSSSFSMTSLHSSSAAFLQLSFAIFSIDDPMIFSYFSYKCLGTSGMLRHDKKLFNEVYPNPACTDPVNNAL